MSIALSEKRLLVSSLLPTELQKEFGKLGKKETGSIALLVKNTALNAIKALEKAYYKKFDANPGDGGCQMRALQLRQLMKRDLTGKLCSNLEEECAKIKGFFRGMQDENSLKELEVSKEMEYLLHCYLSTVLRTPYRTQEDGVILTKSEMSKLSMLSKSIDCLSSKFRNKIVEENQKRLSTLSLEAIHVSSEKITSLEGKEKKLLLTMLSEGHLFTPDEKYEPKAFGCLFYEVKAVLVHLKEEQGIICLKSITKEKKPSYVFLQSKQHGKEFEVLLDEEYISLDPATLIVVFEAVMHVEKTEVIKHLNEHEFTNIVLIQAAQEPPYEPGSSIDDIKNPEASREIMSYRTRKIKRFFTLDHVYLNDFGKELDLKQGFKKG